MPLKSMPLEEPAINLTSMLDVVLLLILYFLFATQFIQEEQQYDIQLPTVPDAVALTGQPDEIVVNVEESGLIVVRSEQKSLTELQALLELAREKFPGQAVVVRGDGRVPYQKVMDVMSIVRRAGIRNLSLANRPNPAGS
ncbi:MAG: biopolymer transporter ExbD [Planctomycetaceae bacterium]|nr:biopolymer transporter ExbD [Planctomycetaceae bacterium]